MPQSNKKHVLVNPDDLYYIRKLKTHPRVPDADIIHGWRVKDERKRKK